MYQQQQQQPQPKHQIYAKQQPQQQPPQPLTMNNNPFFTNQQPQPQQPVPQQEYMMLQPLSPQSPQAQQPPATIIDPIALIQQQIDFINLRLDRIEQIINQHQIIIMLQQQQDYLHVQQPQQPNQQLNPQPNDPQIESQDSKQQQQPHHPRPIDKKDQIQLQLNQTMNHLCNLFEKFFQNQFTEHQQQQYQPNYHHIYQKKGQSLVTMVQPPRDQNLNEQQNQQQQSQPPQSQPSPSPAKKRHENKSKSKLRMEHRDRKESLTKNNQNLLGQQPEEKMKRIGSDVPTILIAPTDYEHIYSIKNQKAMYFENEQHRLAQIKRNEINAQQQNDNKK